MKRILAFLLACSMVLCLMGCQTSPETSVPTQGQLETPSTSTSGTPDTQPTNPDPEPTTPVHVHTWKEATCVRPKTCAECGETEGAPQGHNWLDATTTAPKTCSVCGAQDGDVIFDIPEDVPVFIPENECFEENTTVIVDAITGGESLERIDAVMEDYAEKYVAYSFTATKDEEIVQPTGKLTVTFAIPEGYSDNITVFYVAEDGTLEKLEGTVDPVARTITVELSHFSDYIVVDEGSAEHEHVPEKVSASAPTCEDPGYTTYRCECGYTYLADRVEPTGHSYGRGVITEPSCTQDGKTTYTCHCGHSYENPIPATGHSWNDANCTDPRTCSVCKFTEGTAAGHTWVDATCTAPKTCSVCQSTEGDPLGHKWSEATCIAPKTCSVCQTTDGDALGHKWLDANCTTAKTCSVCQTTDGDPLGHKWTDATCTSPKTCSVCQATEGAVTEHPWDEGVVTKEATEEAEGEKLYTCTACKTTRTEVIPKLDHVHLYDKVEVTAPTCTEKGFTTHTCRCGDTKVDSETPATGHSYESKVTAPTCTEKGYTTHTCHCGDTYKDSETPATGHSYESKVTAPTCTEKGYTTHTCHCGDTYTDAETAATGHSWQNATCTEVKKCTICQATEGTALGHSWKAATCTEPETCSRCAAQQGKPRGHSCANGTCAYCGETIKTYSEGLRYWYNDSSKTSYYLMGIGTCTDTEIVVPPEYNGLPVTKISGLSGSNIKKIHLPETISIISEGVFGMFECSSLEEITVSSDNPYFSTVDGVLYNKDKTRLLRYPAAKQNASFTIPDSVIAIGKGAFYGCQNLQKVVIPEGLLKISDMAFYEAKKLQEITIPNGVTEIGESCFSYCESLQSIVIPDSVVSLSRHAFNHCLNLTNVGIGSGVTTIKYGLFQLCGKLTTVHFGNNVTVIEYGVFMDCTSLTSITLPEKLSSLDAGAFIGCTSLTACNISAINPVFCSVDGVLYNHDKTALVLYPAGKQGTSFAVPESVHSIGRNAFRCSVYLESITFGKDLQSIGGGAFYDCKKLKNVALPSTLTSLGGSAFGNCSSLTSISVPGGITAAEGEMLLEGIFSGCTSLTNVSLGHGIATIGHSAFQGCTSLTEITIPASVTTMGMWVFQDCTNLSQLRFLGAKPEFVDWLFDHKCATTCHAYYPANDPSWTKESVRGIGIAIFWIRDDYVKGYYSTGLDYTLSNDGTYYIVTGIGSCTDISIYVPPTYNGLPVREIGEYAFTECTLSGVVLPEGITRIANGAFANGSLAAILLPKSLESIGSGAFSRTGNLAEIILPDNLRTIGSEAFTGGGPYRLVFPNNYVAFDGLTFHESRIREFYVDPANACYTLIDNVIYTKDMKTLVYCAKSTPGDAEFTIPNSVIHIGPGALIDHWINVMHLPVGLQTIGDYAFAYNGGIKDITIPGSVTHIGEGAFYECLNLGVVTLSEGITYISNYMFAVSSIKSVIFPSTVVSIGESAFYDCSFYSFTIPDTVVTIGARAFAKCDLLDSLHIGSGVVSIGDESFSKCIRLTSVIISNGVTSIGKSAFHECFELTSITIPGSVTSIGDSAFFACTKLASISIPDSVSNIGTKAFYGCCALQSITLPASLSVIKEETFQYCSALTNVIIPASVTKIEKAAFFECQKLTITYTGTKSQWAAINLVQYWCSIADPTSNMELVYIAFKVPVKCTDGMI